MKLPLPQDADDLAYERYKRTIAERWHDRSHAKVLTVGLTSAGCVFALVLLALLTF